jgi:hypothetical protein
MGAHALGAAAYAAKAAGLAAPDRPDAVREEICWQLGRMSAAAKAALRQLPPVGENSSGPLGPGLLATGLLGTIIRDLQASLADPDHALPPGPQVDQEDGKKEEQPLEVHVAERPHSARPLAVPHPDSRWVATPPHPLSLGRRHPAGAAR